VRTRALVLALLLAAACVRVPVVDSMNIEPSAEEDALTVTVSSAFMLHPRTEQMRERVEAGRAAALSGTDPWSIRFARLSTPQQERLTLEKNRGALERVTRVARIPSDDLQQLFSDTNVTVDVIRGEGWREIRFYPGAGGRATREQQREFESELAVWSQAVARYFTAVHGLYSYADEYPQREVYLFAALLEEKGSDGLVPPVTEEEQPLIDAVRSSMDDIAKRMDVREGSAMALEEQADLIFNPFPARITILAPRDILASEGFKVTGNEAVIEPVDLFAAIAGLEGRWIAPDPLAALLRDENVTAAQMAGVERESRPVVSSSEITTALREQLVRPKTYSVRWRD
jgi:hypothetical protein